MATIIYGLIFLWDNGDTNRTIKRQYTKHYDYIIIYNKVEYFTSSGP